MSTKSGGEVEKPELLPCPFCGGVDGVRLTTFPNEFNAKTPWSKVECQRCGMNTGGCLYAEVAIKTWNRRATPAIHRESFVPPEPPNAKSTFAKGLEAHINSHSMENGSDTPDFLLAAYLLDCLEAYDRAVNSREVWYGRTVGSHKSPIGAPAPEPPSGVPPKG